MVEVAAVVRGVAEIFLVAVLPAVVVSLVVVAEARVPDLWLTAAMSVALVVVDV